MFGKLRDIIKYALIGGLGFGAAGAILGYIQGSEDDGWTWILGLAVLGLVLSATLGYILSGRKKAINLAMYGTIAGAIGGYFILDTDFEPWLKLTVIGLVFGLVLGAVLFMTVASGEDFRNQGLRCEDCNARVDKKDKYCPNCGIEFD